MLTGGSSYTTWFGNLVSQKTDGSGLHFMRNRYYDPQTGRFTQQDPIGLAGGLNSYGFAAGDPVNFSDPFGLDCRLRRTNDPCPGFADLVSGWGTALSMLKEFVTGTGPSHRDFGQGSVQAIEMQTAPGVNEARDLFYQTNASALSSGHGPLTTVTHEADFGATGYLASGTSPTRQFLGSYRVTVSPTGNGQITMSVTNVTSMHSALLHLWFVKSHERSEGRTGGNISQTIEWKEPLKP